MPMKRKKIRIRYFAYEIPALRVGHHPSDSPFIGAVHNGALTKTHLTIGVLLGQNVAQVLLATAELAGAGHGKPLGRRALCLHLGHVLLLN